MGRLREDSLLFSLNALEMLERERVEREQADAVSKARAAQQALEREEQLRREAEARRARAELARKREESLREREEQARLDAMREALVERARVEAEWKGRADLERQSRRHREWIAEFEGRGHRRRTRALFASMVVVSGVGVAVAALLGDRLRETTRLVEDQAATLELERESRSRATRLLELSDERVRELARRLVSAEDTSRAQEPASVQGDGRSVPAPHRDGSGAAAERRELAAAPCVDDGDPLSECLPSRLRAAARPPRQ